MGPFQMHEIVKTHVRAPGLLSSEHVQQLFRAPSNEPHQVRHRPSQKKPTTGTIKTGAATRVAGGKPQALDCKAHFPSNTAGAQTKQGGEKTIAKCT